MRYKIMLVEDDPDIASLLLAHLTKFGYLVYCCEDFSDVVGEFEREEPHLVLLDINLPAFDGFYWCGRLRANTLCPIIFLSSRNAGTDQVYAMRSGGDDYITKPFSFEVVTAKIASLLRRVYGEYANSSGDELSCGDCTFSKTRLSLTCMGGSEQLSKTEAGLIRVMFQNYPDVVSREELLNEIWDDESFVEENTLNVTISRIRRKLENIHSSLTIRPVRGVGYRIGENSNEE